MQNQWKSTWVGASWGMLAQDDTSLKPCWRKMTERIDFSLIFRTTLGYQNDTKIDEKIEWFSDALKTVFSAHEGAKGSKMEVQKSSKIKLFLESNKTTESCSRLHAELVFKVWRAPKPHFFRDHFRNLSSCCTGAVVSQTFAENDAPQSVQNHSKFLSKMRWKNNVKSGGAGDPGLRGRRHEHLSRGGRVKPRFTRCTLPKTLCFTEANAKRTIYRKTWAGKKGDFRGKLSLGSTSPLSPTLRSKKKIAERLAERFFFKKI